MARVVAKRRPKPPRRPTTTEAETDQLSPLPPPGAEETGPLRRCIVTRESLPKEKMIRFVLDPDRTVLPDLAARLPGRGMWLSAGADVLSTACAKGMFARAARGAVRVPPDLPVRVRTGLERRILELLGLCRRAGQAVAGYDKAREWLRSERAALIVQASDGSAEERRRFLGDATRIAVVSPLSGAALGKVFGRERTVHVAIAPGRLAQALQADSERLSGLSGPEERIG